MINPLFLPQNSKRMKKTNTQQNTSQTQHYRQYKLIHQLDCIYQGQVNTSYQKQGFGMQQTNDFQTYIGFWKANKANGIGMIIFPQGGIIYGYCKDNQIQGVALLDNKRRLRIGIFKNRQIVGIGYEYNYSQSQWKLCRFHKGIPIDILSTVQYSIENGIPSIMNLHEDMCLLLSKYLNEEFFDIPYKNLIQKPYRPYTEMNVHRINNSYLYFGQVISGKYWGVGMIFDKIKCYAIETGYYQMGELDGYAIKIDKQKNKLEIGLYCKGKKEGFFYERTNNIELIVQYQKNYMKGQRPEFNKQKIKNNQKIFNYQKNDFFSQKNKINFEDYRKLFVQDQKQTNKINQIFKGASKSKSIKKTVLDKNQKLLSPKTNLPKPVASPRYMAPEANFTKSTVQVVRQKLSDIDRLIKRSKALIKQDKSNSLNKSSSPKFNIQISKNIDIKQSGNSDGQIQSQQEPVSKRISSPQKSILRRNQKTLTSTNRALSPQVINRIWSPYKQSAQGKQKIIEQRQKMKNSRLEIQIANQKQNQNSTVKKDNLNSQNKNISGKKSRRIFS